MVDRPNTDVLRTTQKSSCLTETFMLVDLEELGAQPEPIRSQVCIIGAGVAGLSLAQRLVAAGIDVALLKLAAASKNAARMYITHGWRGSNTRGRMKAASVCWVAPRYAGEGNCCPIRRIFCSPRPLCLRIAGRWRLTRLRRFIPRPEPSARGRLSTRSFSWMPFAVRFHLF